jgi:predicted nucleotidyltransferase/predicted transcriptional regulator with HTH domain
MLERLFTSGTRTRLLMALIFNQDREYHLREIARLINSAPINVAKELDNLAKLNLVMLSSKGNLKLYQINKDSPLLPPLRQLFIQTDYLGEELRKYLINAKYAFIYGSFARGEETVKSDIDIFVIGQIKEDNLLKTIQMMEKDTGREINYVLWDEKTFKARKKHPLLKKIAEEKIIMLAGDEDEFRRSIG